MKKKTGSPKVGGRKKNSKSKSKGVSAAGAKGSKRVTKGKGVAKSAKPSAGKGSRKGSGKAVRAKGKGRTTAKKGKPVEGKKAKPSALQKEKKAKAVTPKTHLKISDIQKQPIEERLSPRPDRPFDPKSAFIEKSGTRSNQSDTLAARNRRPIIHTRDEIGNRHH